MEFLVIGITAGVTTSPTEAVIVGAIGGIVVVLAIAFMDKQNLMILLVLSLFTCLLVYGVLRCWYFDNASFDQFAVQAACVGITGGFVVSVQYRFYN